MHPRPEYLLFTEALRHASGRYLWRFALLAADNDRTVTASELVDERSPARTELLALVRGLEAADAPANVRLFSSCGYIHRGLTRGLAQWRSQAWHWERFGRRVPIRDHDLWQRVDRALEFHQIDSRVWGEDEHASSELSFEAYDVSEKAMVSTPRRRPARRRGQRSLPGFGQFRQQVESLLSPTLAPAG